jgi:glycosyltransferase 2 family protein
MRWMRLVLSFALSLLFLYLTFFVPRIGDLFGGSAGLGEVLFGHMRFDLTQLGHVLTTANWVPIGFAGILFFSSLALRAWRWRVMLAPLADISFGGVFSAMCIGYMANNVLPLRMGELYRAHVIHQISGLSRSAAFGNVVLERVTDLFFMMPYLILTVLIFPLPGWLRNGAFATAAAVVMLAAFLIWLAMDRDRALSITRRVLSLLPGKVGTALATLIERFTSGFEVIRRSEHHIGLIVSSLALWAMYAGMAYCVLLSLGFMDSGITAIERNPVGAVLVTLMITTLGFTIPGAPGGVGTYHGLTVLGLSLFDVPGDRAAGFAILLHALNYVPLTVLGLIFFWKLGLSFHETGRMATELKDAAHPATNASVVSGTTNEVDEVGR